MLRNGKQNGIEHHYAKPRHKILDNMNPHFREELGEEKRGECEYYEQDCVFRSP